MPACTYQERPDQLGHLLSGDLPAAEQAKLTAHLESCDDCRRTLDALAARSGFWSDLVLLQDQDDDLDPPTRDFLGKEPQDDEDVPLRILEPTDEPGLLGKLGAYDILRVIGRGGMGVVFQARDQALDRLVAIKVLTPGMAATAAARRRFAREAKAAAAVVHEHVVTIHAVDVTPQGIPYLVMQYIAGKSVQDLVDQERPPELREILRIGSQVAKGLAAAHAQGLIHRDIKPANILLENGVERVKITDFGLARAVDDATMTQSGVVAGTPQYMSPEQARGDAFDHRTDLFSLGSVLYALCTGRAPFRGSSSMGTLKRVCERVPEPIGALNSDIPAWLIKIIKRLHAKDPAGRYATADEVAELLGRCLAHVQQPAAVPLPAELVTRPGRRRIAACMVLALCMLLAASLTFTNVRAAAQHAADYVATVLRLRTPEGTLVVETDDPNVAIKLDGSELVVTGAGVKALRLSVGKHNVQAVKDGKILRDELVTIRRGGRTVLTVRREVEPEMPLPTAARAEQREPGQRPFIGRNTPREEARDNSERRAVAAAIARRASVRDRAAEEVLRMADALKRGSPPPPLTPGAGQRLYMRDLVEGRTTLIVDPASLGVPVAENSDWSRDGRRIVLQIQPRKNDWTQSQLVLIESRKGRSEFRQLGAGCCPSFSPDGQTIAFLLLAGEVPGEEQGVWLMNSDGTKRRRVCETGAPFWSPDSTELLLGSWWEPTVSRIFSFATKRTTRIKVPGQSIFSWPRWVGAHPRRLRRRR